MNFKALATIFVASLTLTGCSLLPTQDRPSQETPEVTEDGILIETEESMVIEGEMPGIDMVLDSGIIPLNASNFTFGVESIEANVGDELVIEITNDSGVHDFVIDELEIGTGIIKEGDTVSVTIPTDKPGTYEYYCSIGKHRELGMVGTLVIK